MKTCKTCGQTKPLDDFYKVNKKSKYHVGTCKVCTIKKQQDNYDPLKKRNENLKRNYGITLEEYLTRLAEQNYQCKVCGTTDPGGRQSGRGGSADTMVVDHCHETGRVRGLLCHRCNRCLGLLSDEVTVLRNMIKYLET